MASNVPSPMTNERPNVAVTQPGVFRNVSRPIGNTNATSGISGPKASSSQSSSELAVPGDYPPDPRIALDSLSDTSENVVEDVGVVIDSTADDLRHAFGVASQYIQDSVTGAVNSVFPSNPTDVALSRGTPGSRFRKEDLAVAGIASDFTPSSSKSRFSATGAQSMTPRNSRFNPRDLAIGGIASDFTPSSSKSRMGESIPNLDDDHHRANADPAMEAKEAPSRGRSAKPAFVSYAPGPVVNVSKSTRDVDKVPAYIHGWDNTAPPNSSKNPFATSTSFPASKEKKDNDVERGTAAFAPKSKDLDRTTDLRKRAMESAAVGAGNGIGGSAYERGRPEGRSTNKDDSKATDAAEEQQPAFVTYAPAPVITDAPSRTNEGVSGNDAKLKSDKGALDANDLTRTESDRRPLKHKKGIETVALGAGIGTIGGASYAHSGRASDQTRYTGAPQPEGIDKSNRDASTRDVRAAPVSGRRDSDEAQPAFATYAPAPVITDDEEVGSRYDKEKSTSAIRDEGYHSDGEKQDSGKDSGRDTRLKQGLGAGAIGAGGALGSAAYASSRSRRQGLTEETPKGASSDSGTNIRSGTQAPAPASHSQPSSKPSSNVPDEIQPQAPQNNSKSNVQSSNEKTSVAAGSAAGATAAKRNKSTEEEQAKREKEIAKREKEMKQHEKDVAAADRKARKEEKAADKDHAKRAKEVREREKEVKKREEQMAAAAVAKDQKVQGNEPLDEGSAEGGGDKDAKKNHAAAGVTGAAGGGVAGAGLVNASTDDESKKRPSASSFYSEHSETNKPRAESKDAAPVHPSSKAASAPPQRPGPVALGASGPDDKAMSGADSDFPLAAEGADDGSQINGSTGSGKYLDPASGEGGGPVGTEPYRPRSRYHGTEGLQEKQQGGILKSSTIENMKSGAANEYPTGHGNGNGKGNGGKKEGFVRHIVEKVKDRLHK